MMDIMVWLKKIRKWGTRLVVAYLVLWNCRNMDWLKSSGLMYQAKGLKVTCLLCYCSEGDNTSDAFQLADAACKLLRLSHPNSGELYRSLVLSVLIFIYCLLLSSKQAKHSFE